MRLGKEPVERPMPLQIRARKQSSSWAYRHGMVKNIVGIVTSFCRLQRWIKASLPIEQLRPERISQHILVRIVDVTTLIAIIPIWRLFILRMRIWTGVKVAEELLD